MPIFSSVKSLTAEWRPQFTARLELLDHDRPFSVFLHRLDHLQSRTALLLKDSCVFCVRYLLLLLFVFRGGVVACFLVML